MELRFIVLQGAPFNLALLRFMKFVLLMWPSVKPKETKQPHAPAFL